MIQAFLSFVCSARRIPPNPVIELANQTEIWAAGKAPD
jgi:hypothetical protein